MLFIAGLELPTRINKVGVNRILEDFFMENFGLPEVSINIKKYFTTCPNRRSMVFAGVDANVCKHVFAVKHFCLKNSSITVDRVRSRSYLINKRRMKARQFSEAPSEAVQEVAISPPPPPVSPPAAIQLSPSVGDSFDDGNAGITTFPLSYKCTSVIPPLPSPADPDKFYPVEEVLAEKTQRVNGRKVLHYLYKYEGYDEPEWHPARNATQPVRREWNKNKAAKKAAEGFLEQLQQETVQASQQESTEQETPTPRNLRRSKRLNPQANGEQIILA